MRNVAEFDNYKKRNARIWQDAYSEGRSDVVLKILPIGDNLDSAIAMCKDESTEEGLKLLKKKFDEVLKNLEVEEVNPEGEVFDPLIAEAVMQVEKGEMTLRIADETSAPLYQGDGSACSEFLLAVPETGDYSVSLTGHRAKGYVEITVLEAEE